MWLAGPSTPHERTGGQHAAPAFLCTPFPFRAEPACQSDFNPQDGIFLDGVAVAAAWITLSSGESAIIKSYNFAITPALSGSEVHVLGRGGAGREDGERATKAGPDGAMPLGMTC